MSKRPNSLNLTIKRTREDDDGNEEKKPRFSYELKKQRYLPPPPASPSSEEDTEELPSNEEEKEEWLKHRQQNSSPLYSPSSPPYPGPYDPITPTEEQEDQELGQKTIRAAAEALLQLSSATPSTLPRLPSPVFDEKELDKDLEKLIVASEDKDLEKLLLAAEERAAAAEKKEGPFAAEDRKEQALTPPTEKEDIQFEPLQQPLVPTAPPLPTPPLEEEEAQQNNEEDMEVSGILLPKPSQLLLTWNPTSPSIVAPRQSGNSANQPHRDDVSTHSHTAPAGEKKDSTKPLHEKFNKDIFDEDTLKQLGDLVIEFLNRHPSWTQEEAKNTGQKFCLKILNNGALILQEVFKEEECEGNIIFTKPLIDIAVQVAESALCYFVKERKFPDVTERICNIILPRIKPECASAEQQQSTSAVEVKQEEEEEEQQKESTTSAAAQEEQQKESTSAVKQEEEEEEEEQQKESTTSAAAQEEQQKESTSAINQEEEEEQQKESTTTSMAQEKEGEQQEQAAAAQEEMIMSTEAQKNEGEQQEHSTSTAAAQGEERRKIIFPTLTQKNEGEQQEHSTSTAAAQEEMIMPTAAQNQLQQPTVRLTKENNQLVKLGNGFTAILTDRNILPYAMHAKPALFMMSNSSQKEMLIVQEEIFKPTTAVALNSDAFDKLCRYPWFDASDRTKTFFGTGAFFKNKTAVVEKLSSCGWIYNDHFHCIRCPWCFATVSQPLEAAKFPWRYHHETCQFFLMWNMPTGNAQMFDSLDASFMLHRLNTFNTWPRRDSAGLKRKTDLARAGLIYTGASDIVMCLAGCCQVSAGGKKLNEIVKFTCPTRKARRIRCGMANY